MHGARHRLSEPRSAGKAPAVCFSSQRVTSVGDSFLFILACGPLHTHRQEKNCAHKNATSLGFYVLTCVSRQKLVRVFRCRSPAGGSSPANVSTTTPATTLGNASSWSSHSWGSLLTLAGKV